MGIVIDSKEYRGTHRNSNSTSVKHALIRIALSLVIIIPLYVCPIFLIRPNKFVLLILFVKYGVPSLIMGIMLYGYSKLVYQRYKLLNEEEIMDTDSNVSFLSQKEENKDNSDNDSEEEKEEDARRKKNKDKTIEQYDKAMKKKISTF